jgi:hypothetical protein
VLSEAQKYRQRDLKNITYQELIIIPLNKNSGLICINAWPIWRVFSTPCKSFKHFFFFFLFVLLSDCSGRVQKSFTFECPKWEGQFTIDVVSCRNPLSLGFGELPGVDLDLRAKRRKKSFG